MKGRKRVRRIGKTMSLKAAAVGERVCSTPGEAAGTWAEAAGWKGRQEPKKRITLFLDADVLAWFKDQGPRYQRAINQALREVMEEEKINLRK